VIRLDAATVMLQWAAGGMFFCWFTTRRRIIGVGYGWLLRSVYLGFALLAVWFGFRFDPVAVRDVAAIGVAVTCAVALAVSIRRRAAGVSGQRAEFDRRSERVAAMTGIRRAADDATDDAADDAAPPLDEPSASGAAGRRAEYPPALDLLPAVVGAVGLVAAALASVDGGASSSTADTAVALFRTFVSAAFIGAISNAMLLGHWYLVQPGLPRSLLNEMVTALLWLWPLEVVAMLLPTGMISVLDGTVDDGWGGLLGWMWATCAVTTLGLIIATRAALRERYYSAVMAATGLLYLAILTAFGTDIVARAVLDQT
jgi:hypothetical protein